MEYIKSLYDESISSDPYRRYEYFAGSPISRNTAASYKATVDCVIPIKAEPGSIVRVVNGGKEFIINFDGEKAQNARWIRVNAGNEMIVLSDKDIFVGNPISLIQEQPHKHKLVLFLLVDSLAQTVIENDGFEKIMPYSSRFFSNAIYMKECYCCADWTMPACGTIFTGKYPSEHKLIHPAGGKLEHTTFVQLFKNAGYLTGYFNSNWRMPPEYGYMEGFDRGVYCWGQYRGKAVDLIEKMMDHLYAFPNRDHFIMLSVLDLHHHFYMELPREIGTQVQEPLDAQGNHNASDPNSNAMAIAEIYKEQLKFMDYKLQILYDFLSHKYAPGEYTVLFCGDHGDAHIGPSDFMLDNYNNRCVNKEGDSKLREVVSSLYRALSPIHQKLKLMPLWPHIVCFLMLHGFPLHILHQGPHDWPHFRTAVQKTPLIIQTDSTQREAVTDLTDLRSVYDLFEQLLSEHREFNNEIIKRICKRDYVYNESIYPGQTYKAKIIDDENVLYFESNALVDNNCMLKDAAGTTAVFLRKNHKRIIDDSIVLDKYVPVIQEHLSRLLNEPVH